jgi:hypothetical protein
MPSPPHVSANESNIKYQHRKIVHACNRTKYRPAAFFFFAHLSMMPGRK